MAYVLLALLAIAIVLVFSRSTREYRSWALIKERWFRAGIDNAMVFSSQRLDGGECAQLDGEYSGCPVQLATVEGRASRSVIRVGYPPALSDGLRAYSASIFDRMLRVLETGEIEEDVKPKRLHPRVCEQLVVLREQTGGRGSFEMDSSGIRFIQPGLLPDPNALFPVLDEIVVTVNIIAEHVEHLLVQ